MIPLLIDLDGVLRMGKTPAPGLKEFFNYLEESKRPACILSNTTLSTGQDVKYYFSQLALTCPIPLMTAADAAFEYARGKYKNVKVFGSPNVHKLFEPLVHPGTPEAVIVGDMYKDWNFSVMNEIFLNVIKGADFIAMQKNRYWSTPEDGLLLDAGAFISAIEYASGEEALLIGKPSPLYFEMALKIVGLKPGDPFLMLGDDLDIDIRAAKILGGQGILIFTGKTQKPLSIEDSYAADYEVDNLSETISLLRSI
ncbi:MAG: HAD hydrolase-like protein [Ignavibacteriales bacterium]|nr:HAD hydrolase-like protein [Ignavibacteriales bacterium]MCF8306561.1 HAD hydrolase-like protein [Ignavibacteriales bacterium]MCF8316360.1 HAD hydrolase-like protein [Ignavibacteriales bacterium]MCF8437682.1 HAD hydrolase-like protein [Ignavibacteriales bacterium]